METTKAMSSAERVRLSRWVNKVEEVADNLLNLLQTGPNPLPRTPIIDPELLHRISLFTLEQDDVISENYPKVRFLKLGNGNQHSNKRRAIACVVQVLEDSKIIDHRTIEVPRWGKCHFAAYTHAKGAMISTPNREDNDYGSADWHSRDHICMFRDTGDGRCIVYIANIKPLFEMRTIGHHGVTWEAVQKIAKFSKVISSKDALASEKRETSTLQIKP